MHAGRKEQTSVSCEDLQVSAAVLGVSKRRVFLTNPTRSTQKPHKPWAWQVWRHFREFCPQPSPHLPSWVTVEWTQTLTSLWSRSVRQVGTLSCPHQNRSCQTACVARKVTEGKRKKSKIEVRKNTTRSNEIKYYLT